MLYLEQVRGVHQSEPRRGHYFRWGKVIVLDQNLDPLLLAVKLPLQALPKISPHLVEGLGLVVQALFVPVAGSAGGVQQKMLVRHRNRRFAALRERDVVTPPKVVQLKVDLVLPALKHGPFEHGEECVDHFHPLEECTAPLHHVLPVPRGKDGRGELVDPVLLHGLQYGPEAQVVGGDIVHHDNDVVGSATFQLHEVGPKSFPGDNVAPVVASELLVLRVHLKAGVVDINGARKVHVVGFVALERVQGVEKQRGSPWVAVARDDDMQGASLLGLQGQQPQRNCACAVAGEAKTLVLTHGHELLDNRTEVVGGPGCDALLRQLAWRAKALAHMLVPLQIAPHIKSPSGSLDAARGAHLVTRHARSSTRCNCTQLARLWCDRLVYVTLLCPPLCPSEPQVMSQKPRPIAHTIRAKRTPQVGVPDGIALETRNGLRLEAVR
mmetsp:Transcript_5859/g.14469  ORF Transcript_5859/g.14469 Transcript_5859/m.14469 type:complete len:438 (+) Transcript_5859:1258-2571(+)